MPGGGANPALAVALVVDDRDRQMRLLAHRLAARSDRVQPRRERPQRLHERGRVPSRRVPAQQIGELHVLEHASQLNPVRGLEHRGERRLTGPLRVLREEGSCETGQLAVRRQPLPEHLRLPIDCNRFRAIETRGREHLVHDQRRILVPHPERVARFVCQARSLERQLDVAHVLRRVAPGDALVGKHRRGIRLLAGVIGRGRHGTEARNRRDGGRTKRLARATHDLFEPGNGRAAHSRDRSRPATADGGRRARPAARRSGGRSRRTVDSSSRRAPAPNTEAARAWARASR